jgi:hypothetical protein
MTRFVLAILFLGAACGTDPQTSGDDDTGGCETGATQGCTCATGGLGVQTCSDSGAYGACEQCAPPDPDMTKVNFQAQIVPILEKSCGAGNTACHARNQYGAAVNMNCRGWLALENVPLGAKFYSGPNEGQSTGCPDKTLYQRLTQIIPWECAAPSYYIKASDPAKSYVMNKINGSPLCSEGGAPSVQMPPSDSMFTLAAADKALIEQWIVEGALDN